jgi:hypothetical protein
MTPISADPLESAGQDLALPPEEPKEDPQDIAKRWLASIAGAQKALETFYKRGDRITKRYKSNKDSRGADTRDSTGTKFNLFWSNVQTLGPATYSRRPKVEVSRRFRDQDPIARLAASILQRALQYEVDSGFNFHNTVKACVLDRLLPGMGTAWVRYEPAFKTEPQEVPTPDGLATTQEDVEVVADEKTPVDYVFWKDFLVSPARSWADVRWAARRVMFSKEALQARFAKTVEKFGGKISEVVCNYDPNKVGLDAGDRYSGSNSSGASDIEDPSLKRALVWEIWDKESKQLIWVCVGYQFPLDIADDPANLDGFFPCPEPLFATQTNDSLEPTADFVIYADQLRALDDVSNRIDLLTSALRVIGVYDASQASLQSLLQSGMENRMVPVNQWAAFAEKGGLKGVMDFLPLEQVFNVLKGLYQAREELKQNIYEITGMADIVRGASVASETLGAQQIKAKFANLRLSSRQQQVAEFVTQILRLKADLMCELYSPETILRIASADQLLEAQQHPDRVQAAIALLKDEKTRKYRIDVAADSMIELDEVDERERRNEFMSNVSNFFLAMKNVTAIGPEMVPIALEMLKFVVRGFAVGRGLEAAIEDASDAVVQRSKNPPPPPPTPDEIKMYIAQMGEQAETFRLRLKEDAATDREELKASVQLTIAGLEQQIQAVMQQQAMLDQASDADDQQDFSALQPQPLPVPGQQPPPQPGPPQGPPQGAPQ